MDSTPAPSGARYRGTVEAIAALKHVPPQGFWRKHVFSLDHKVIGKQYLDLALVAVVTGMVLSWLMRFHLAFPAAAVPGLGAIAPNAAPGGVITPELYLSLMTMHGTIMVFFVLTTAPFAGFGNFVLPIQVGAEDMAFPRFNMMSFWVTFVAFLVLIAAFFVEAGPPLSGWTAYAPLSAVGKDAGPGQGTGQTLWAVSIAIFCVGQLLGSLNFIATTLDLRTRGMTLMRMPFSTWAWFITSVIGLIAFSVLLPACVLLILDRVAGTSFFIPAGLVISDRLQPHAGGSPLLWQHLFWFFGHPEVYIAILPGFGIVSHILPAFARKPLLGPKIAIGCMAAIGFLSYTVWGHHMFLSGMNPLSATLFSVPTLIITIPATIVTLLWIGTVYGARLRFTTSALFCLGFVSVFVSGGISGFFLAQPSIDTYLHGTYFVVGHFHFVMGVASMFGIFAGVYFWFPKMYGRMMNETLGKIHFTLTLIGVYCIFMPMHYLGLAGNVRRYSAFTDDYMKGSLPLHRFITMAAFFTGAVQLIFLFNLVWSRLRGAKAPDNPWQATSLEWSVSSPPPFDNFGGPAPQVYHGPNEYGLTGPSGDYRMQADPASTTGGSLTWAPRTRPPRRPARTGVWIAIATISMSFAAYTSALLVRQGATPGWAEFRLPPILYLNTLVLLASSATIAVGRRRMAATGAGATPTFASLGGGWLALTLGLGLLFVAGQLLAWRDLAAQGLYLASNPGSSFFYVFTGLHALHLLGGITALGYVLWRLRRAPEAPPVNAAGATALYWHFMDLLWLYLLFVLALRL